MKNTNKNQTVSKKKNLMFSPRTEYSREEIESLLSQIDGIVSACKAEREGVDPTDMIKTVRGGKVVWITREEMNKMLAKKWKLSGIKFAQRSIRGEDSLSSEINRRVHTCQVLIDVIRKAARKDVTELTKRARELEATRNRSLSLAREVRMLEAAIQRMRSEDPILRDMDQATDEMVAALEKQDVASADLCRIHCDRYAEEYHAKLKRVEPYINKARERRMQFLMEKRKLYLLEFNLIALGENILSSQIPEILFRDKKGDTAQALVSLAEGIRSLVAEARPDFETLVDCPLEELESRNEALTELDKKFLTPLFEKTMEFVEEFRRAWEHFVEGASDIKSNQAAGKEKHRLLRRMTYQEKSESGG